MKKACIVTSIRLQNNVIFDEQNYLNRDNIFNKYIELKKIFMKHGYSLTTNDINSIEQSEVILYFDMPKILPTKNKIKHSFLILMESELIKADNYHEKKHKYFNKIFTWHDDLIDNNKYFKINFSHKFPKSILKKIKIKEKLCTLIAGNKGSNHSLELYSKRIEAIRWFEKNNPDDFDLYGQGWDKPNFARNKVLRALNRFPNFTNIYIKFKYKPYPSYKGMVENKKTVMEKYKFSICYENARDIPGYITEKIFDSFFAGCVPIYLGANNIGDYIPKNCFIDKREFETYSELYLFIKNMSDKDYTKYLINIKSYLNSEKSIEFRGESFANKIAQTIFQKNKLQN